MGGHDAARTNRASLPGPSVGVLKWIFLTGNPQPLGTPVVAADGTIYVPAKDTSLYAVNPDGTKKWKSLPVSIILSSPAIGANGDIYTVFEGASVGATGSDGVIKWVTPDALGADTSSPALGADGSIYFAAATSLYAFKCDGTPGWSRPLGAVSHASPAIGAGGVMHVGAEDSTVIATDGSGVPVWTFPTSAIPTAGPVVGPDGTIYTLAKTDGVRAITPAGAPKWQKSVMLVDGAPAITEEGRILVVTSSGLLQALSPDDGSVVWATQLSDPMGAATSVIGGDGTVYVVTGQTDPGQPNVHAIDASGMGKWSLSTGSVTTGAPVIGTNGTLYVPGDKGRLYAIGQ